MKSHTKYLFFDVDGTLSFDGETVGAKNIEYIKKVQAMGHRVIINTGRSMAYVPPKILSALDWDGIIAGSTYVVFNGEVICDKTLSVESLNIIYNYCRERDIMCLFEGVEKVYATKPHPNGWNLIDDYLPIRDELRITKVTAWSPVSAKDIALFKGVNVISLPGYFEGVLEGHDKDSGLRAIVEYSHADREDTIAFGDSLNDEAMLKYAGKSIIMNHAPRELDRYAFLRTDTDEDGVAEGLSKLFNI